MSPTAKIPLHYQKKLPDGIRKIAAIHDITGIGRCGLSVVIPVLSAMGHQVCPLPTGVLSTHPAGFQDFHLNDLTADTKPIFDHWLETDITFDCIYSGYMCSEVQLDETSSFLSHIKKKSHMNPLFVVDPVMGDNGSLYSIFNDGMVDKMLTLCRQADLITPNYTEACILLGVSYSDAPLGRDKQYQFAKALSDLCDADVVVKGIPLKTVSGKGATNICYRRRGEKFQTYSFSIVPQNYPGTGDIFASTLIGKLLKDSSLAESVVFATDFLTQLVATTYEQQAPIREGVLLESMLSVISESYSK